MAKTFGDILEMLPVDRKGVSESGRVTGGEAGIRKRFTSVCNAVKALDFWL